MARRRRQGESRARSSAFTRAGGRARAGRDAVPRRSRAAARIRPRHRAAHAGGAGEDPAAGLPGGYGRASAGRWTWAPGRGRPARRCGAAFRRRPRGRRASIASPRRASSSADLAVALPRGRRALRPDRRRAPAGRAVRRSPVRRAHRRAGASACAPGRKSCSAPGGTIVLVEPALRETSRELLAVRDRLLACPSGGRRALLLDGRVPGAGARARLVPRRRAGAVEPARRLQLPGAARRAGSRRRADPALLRSSAIRCPRRASSSSTRAAPPAATLFVRLDRHGSPGNAAFGDLVAATSPGSPATRRQTTACASKPRPSYETLAALVASFRPVGRHAAHGEGRVGRLARARPAIRVASSL